MLTIWTSYCAYTSFPITKARKFVLFIIVLYEFKLFYFYVEISEKTWQTNKVCYWWQCHNIRCWFTASALIVCSNMLSADTCEK